MRRTIVALAWLVFAGLVAACATTPPVPPVENGPGPNAVRVISNGWHTAIVIPRAEVVATGLLPEADDFPDAAFLEFGWGDREYYPARIKTLGMTLGAVFTATPAVMHMAGLARAPKLKYARLETVTVALTKSGLRRLVRSIARDLKRPEGGRAKPISRGLYPNSNFYDARGAFHLFNTCNTWTARKLRAGGVKLSPFGIITADELVAHLRAALGPNRLSGGITNDKRFPAKPLLLRRQWQQDEAAALAIGQNRIRSVRGR